VPEQKVSDTFGWLTGSLLRSDLLKVAIFLDAFKSASIWKPQLLHLKILPLRFSFF
jgi:hypothetical protein